MIFSSLLGAAGIALDAAAMANANQAAAAANQAAYAQHYTSVGSIRDNRQNTPPPLRPKLGRTPAEYLPPQGESIELAPHALICSVCNRPVHHLFVYNRPDLDSFIVTALCHNETESVRIPFKNRAAIEAIRWHGVSGKAFTDPAINMWEPISDQA